MSYFYLQLKSHLLSHQKENISLATQTPTNREVHIHRGGVHFTS